jgi:outer membrane protein OmpA-like peptidoglycan-associated protein
MTSETPRGDLTSDESRRDHLRIPERMPKKRYQMVIFLALAILLGAYAHPAHAWDIALMKYAPQKTIVETPESYQYMICDRCPPLNDLHETRPHEAVQKSTLKLFQRSDTPQEAKTGSEQYVPVPEARPVVTLPPGISLSFSQKQDTENRAGRQPAEQSQPSAPGKPNREEAVAMITSSAAPPERAKTPAAGPSQHESLLTVYFDFDSSDLKGGEKAKIEQAVKRLKAAERIRVTGYTCDLGPTDYNVRLGLRRATSVARYLIELGIEGHRISKDSHGPCLDAVSHNGRHSLNRRAEIITEP